MAERFREEIGGTRFRENGLTDVTEGFDFSLDTEENTEGMSAGIDFSLDKDTASFVPETRPVIAEGAGKTFSVIDFSMPRAEDDSLSARLKEIKKYFSEKASVYAERDSILMDAEQLSRLSSPPLFIMGIAAAIMFYYVLVIFAELDGDLNLLLVLVCIFAGVLPSLIIIPNAVKISKKTKEAKILDSELREHYEKSPYSDEISFEYTNPYILSELIEAADYEGADDIAEAEQILTEELDDEETLSRNKKQADCSDSEEIAYRAAALYVLGKKLMI